VGRTPGATAASTRKRLLRLLQTGRSLHLRRERDDLDDAEWAALVARLLAALSPARTAATDPTAEMGPAA
jgi:hypothetical protein